MSLPLPASPRRAAVTACTLLVAILTACGETRQASPTTSSRRVPAATGRVFDALPEAELTATPHDADVAQDTVTETFRFEDDAPRLWLGIESGRRVAYRVPSAGEIDASADGGRNGGRALRLGPGSLPDRAAAVTLVRSGGFRRVEIEGRVHLESNPMAHEASTREVLRVIEHHDAVNDPSDAGGWRRYSSTTHRVSRTIDPSGWDRFGLTFISDAETQVLEIQWLHRNGGSDQAITRYDDVTISQTPLREQDVYAHLIERCRDVEPATKGAAIPRLRVPLAAAFGDKEETRDAVLLPPPITLAIPVRLPATPQRPRLRFAYGMLADAHAAAGDGAEIEVAFVSSAGGETILSTHRFDPKNDPDARPWQHASIDLSAHGGLDGTLRFSTRDVPGSERDALDAVVIATPRIEHDSPEPRPNLLLIGVDTLRADRVSALGYDRDTTPNLARLAADGVRFTQARSQAPWTLPSFASIMTSLPPSAHGAGRGGHDEWTPIDPGSTALAEVLRSRGWLTQGVVANGLISPQYGIDQGFEAYQSAWAMESARDDAAIVTHFIEEHRAAPWFLFWHIMDPHLPYSTSRDEHARFTDPNYRGRFARGRGEVPFQALDPRPGRRWYTHEGPPPMPDLQPDDRQYIADYYDAEIAEMDAALGQVLDALETSGQWSRTIVAFVADHGEGLGDHDHYHHGYTLYDDQVHVPLILRAPGVTPRTIDRPVAAIDLAPTLLGVLGVEPPPLFQGVDRLAADAPHDDAVIIEYPTYDSSAQKAWIQGRFKYLHDPLFHTEALFDLAADPRESRDVKELHADVVARARTELDRFRWEQVQRGRYHLRLRAKAGGRLRVRVDTDDLFDANFVSRPAVPEQDASMDLERRHLEIDTELAGDRFEIVFWCRGSSLSVDITVDDQPLSTVRLGATTDARPLPLAVALDEIPRLATADVPPPTVGTATLWLEAGLADLAPVLPSPEEIERLSEMGYVR